MLKEGNASKVQVMAYMDLDVQKGQLDLITFPWYATLITN